MKKLIALLTLILLQTLLVGCSTAADTDMVSVKDGADMENTSTSSASENMTSSKITSASSSTESITISSPPESESSSHSTETANEFSSTESTAAPALSESTDTFSSTESTTAPALPESTDTFSSTESISEPPLPEITEASSSTGDIQNPETSEENELKRQMKLSVNGREIVFELNGSAAANSLYDQLPFEISVSNYSNDEKIFYPPESLDTNGAVSADAKVGTLAYFSPWGDVDMFYDNFGSYSGLYELGFAVTGAEYIQSIPEGTYTFEKGNAN